MGLPEDNLKWQTADVEVGLPIGVNCIKVLEPL